MKSPALPFSVRRTLLATALVPALSLSLYAAPVLAQDAHVHGEAVLKIVVDEAGALATFEAPAVDIVGFEYEPRTDAEKQAVADGIALLSNPSTVLTLTPAAGCEATMVDVEFEAEGDEHHDDDEHGDEHHDDDEHGEEYHDEDEHGDEHHDDDEHGDEHHDDDEHGDEHHDDDEHGDEHHDDDEHGDEHHDDDEHEEIVEHMSFHAEYDLACANAAAIEGLATAVFGNFPALQEMEVEVITASGQKGAELTPSRNSLDF